MKKLFVLLLLVGVAFISAPQLTAEKVMTTADYQDIIDGTTMGERIPTFIPTAERFKLKGICCDPPGSPCQAYCCWRCPDPGKGGLN